MPATEEVFRLRSCVVPIELKQPCRADGACPSASTGLGPTAKEGGDPISTPWSSGACTPTTTSDTLLLQVSSLQSFAGCLQRFMLDMSCKLLSRLCSW